MNNKKLLQDEIDLLGLAILIWKNQLKIYLIAALTIIISLGYYSSQSSSYNAKTNIETISIFEELKYSTYNSYLKNFFSTKLSSSETNDSKKSVLYETPFQMINKKLLIDLFISTLKQGDITRKAIKDSNLINKQDYKNNKKYEDAVSKLAASIKFIPSKTLDDDEWQIHFKTTDIVKWNNFLSKIEKPINENVQYFLGNTLKELIVTQEKLLNYKIDDLNQNIYNELKFFNSTYKKNNLNRLSFLEEQAQIARSLGIENSQADIFINSETKSELRPYYTRGFKLIEEEIILLKSQTNNLPSRKAFVLEKERNILLISKKNIKRFEELINKSPLKNSDNFRAGKINLLTTKYTNNRTSLKKQLIYAFLTGMLLGIFFVVTQVAIKNHK